MKQIFTIKNAIILCATLGLAPFSPEPHILGKTKWIIGGGTGMQMIDWLDTLMHGTPWVILIVMLSLKLKEKLFNYFFLQFKNSNTFN